MTTPGMYDASAALDAESDRTPVLIRRQRARWNLATLSLLSAALLALFGVAYAMYARTLTDAPPVRMGTSR